MVKFDCACSVTASSLSTAWSAHAFFFFLFFLIRDVWFGCRLHLSTFSGLGVGATVYICRNWTPVVNNACVCFPGSVRLPAVCFSFATGSHEMWLKLGYLGNTCGLDVRFADNVRMLFLARRARKAHFCSSVSESFTDKPGKLNFFRRGL